MNISNCSQNDLISIIEISYEPDIVFSAKVKRTCPYWVAELSVFRGEFIIYTDENIFFDREDAANCAVSLLYNSSVKNNCISSRVFLGYESFPKMILE